MSQQDKAWTGRWVAGKIRDLKEVSSVTLFSPQHIQLERKDYSPIVVGTTADKRLDAAILNPLISHTPVPDFVVNIPKESYIAGSALEIAAMRRIGIGGLGDLMRAVRLPDVGEYVNPEIEFLERGLTQHSRIERFNRKDDRSYFLIRKGLSSLRVVFLHEYELTADHLRTAVDRYGEFDIAVISNPNGNATSSASNVASSMSCRIYKWGVFLGALNRP